jgi:hypothetical protein
MPIVRAFGPPYDPMCQFKVLQIDRAFPFDRSTKTAAPYGALTKYPLKSIARAHASTSYTFGSGDLLRQLQLPDSRPAVSLREPGDDDHVVKYCVRSHAALLRHDHELLHFLNGDLRQFASPKVLAEALQTLGSLKRS